MNHSELIEEVAGTLVGTVDPKQVKAIVDLYLASVKRELIDGKDSTLGSLGKLKVLTKPAKTGRNPRTGEVIQIPERVVVKFNPSAQLKVDLSKVSIT